MSSEEAKDEKKPEVSEAVSQAAGMMAAMAEELGRMARGADEMRLEIVRQGESIGGPAATSLAQLYGALRRLATQATQASDAALGKGPAGQPAKLAAPDQRPRHQPSPSRPRGMFRRPDKA
jgi:hypothetical protein